MAISSEDIQSAWRESVNRRLKASEAPDLSDEADRSHFWTIVMKKYKSKLPLKNYSGAMAFIMGDSETLDEFNAGIMESGKISDKDKPALLKEIAGYFKEASAEWKAKNG